jgi:hypothetical protein
MKDEVQRVLEEEARPMTAGAVTVMVGRIPTGTLGEEPDPDVAEALVRLRGEGTAASVEGCSVCGRPGTLWTTSEHVRDSPAPVPLTETDTAEAMAPLIDEGAIEVGERVELVEDDCCLRSARPWRPTPKPV